MLRYFCCFLKKSQSSMGSKHIQWRIDYIGREGLMQFQLIFIELLLFAYKISIMSTEVKTQLTHGQQTGRVALLGVTFMIMFTAFNSLQNIVSKIYGQYGYDNLGETSVLVLYFVFGACTFITPFFIRRFGYKKVMFLSSLGYAVYEGVGLIISLNEDLPKGLGWTMVILGAMLCGASASMIWVAQGAYVSQVAGQARKTELFGLFWSLMMSSQILGNLITTFVLGLISNVTYFLVLTILGFGSSLLFLLLPDVQKADQSGDFSLKSQSNKVISILKQKKYRYLLLYYFFPGLCVAFYATFLYKLIGLSIKQGVDEQKSEYNKRVSFYSGLVFISLGVSQALTGFVMSRIGERFCKFKLAVIGTLWVQIAGFVSLLCYFLQLYPLCFAVAFLWGSAETFLQTNTGALIGIVFPGKVEAFSVYRIIFALGTTTTIVLNIALKSVPAWVFLTIVMAVQVLTSGISNQIIDLKQKRQENTSLLQSTDPSS